jgi:hypothetical protein
MASNLPCSIPVRSYLEESVCRLESTNLCNLHTYVEVLFFPKHKIGVLFVVLKSTHLLTSHRWCDSNMCRKKSLLCVHRYPKVKKCSVSCFTCTAYYIAPVRTFTCSLRENKESKKQDALYKTQYHSENKVQNITLSLDVINQRLKYRFLSDCLWFNEVKFSYMFYELGPRISVCIIFFANTILMFIYTVVISQGMTLKAERSQVRFPKVSFEFFKYVIRPAALWLRVRQSICQIRVKKLFLGRLRYPVRKADKLTTFTLRLSWNLGASFYRNPQGLSWPVMELFSFKASGSRIHIFNSIILSPEKYRFWTGSVHLIISPCPFY